MSVFTRHPVCQAILITAMALSMVTVAAAQEAAPASGLGQSWPNATDISNNAHYHVYRFERDGVTYIQINDLQGQVRAAVATAQGTTFTLPIGADAQNVAVTSDRSPTDATQVVYQDNGLALAVEPQSDGSLNVMAMIACPPDQCIQNMIITQ